MTRPALVVCVGLALWTLTGCATGGGAAGQSSPTPRADLAGQAEVAPANLDERPVGNLRKAKAKHAERAEQGRPARQEKPAATAAPGVPPGAAGAPVTWRSLRSATDARGDQGNGPAYADVTSLVLDDDGTHLRATVQLGGTVPGRLADGEVMGIGVDLFRSASQESDFQIFLDGGAHGWRGFLQTPRGFVKYPGTLAVEGRALVAVVPWASLGGREGAQVSAFADWANGRGGTSADAVDRGVMPVG